MSVYVEIWPEMVHVWHLFHPELSAGRRAIEKGGAFVRANMAAYEHGLTSKWVFLAGSIDRLIDAGHQLGR
jgi:hypothetical protein